MAKEDQKSSLYSIINRHIAQGSRLTRQTRLAQLHTILLGQVKETF